MTTCPSCNHEEQSGAEEFPAAVRNDMSMFIGLSHMLDDDQVDVVRCVNCGKYFDRLSNAVVEDLVDSLLPAENCVDRELWTDLLKLPPDLFRVVANECRLGNRVCGFVRGTEPNGWHAFYLDGFFRDGHMVSSWVKQRSRFVDGLDLSSYVCDARRVAVCSQKSQAEAVADQPHDPMAES
jgi:hypothetical protein